MRKVFSFTLIFHSGAFGPDQKNQRSAVSCIFITSLPVRRNAVSQKKFFFVHKEKERMPYGGPG
jgi:hypothetical protein